MCYKIGPPTLLSQETSILSWNVQLTLLFIAALLWIRMYDVHLHSTKSMVQGSSCYRVPNVASSSHQQSSLSRINVDDLFPSLQSRAKTWGTRTSANPYAFVSVKTAYLLIFIIILLLASWPYSGWLVSWLVSLLDSGTEGPGFKSQSRRCRVTVLGKLFTPIVPLFTKQQNW